MQTYTMLGEGRTSLSHPLLKGACARHWGLAPLPPITKEQWGKPTFQSKKHHFNLSQSGSVAICCLSDCPVGVDIQLPRPSRTGFLDQICSPQERSWLQSLGDSPQSFALLWAMKESLVKYTGRGITRPLSALAVPLPPVLPTSDGWAVYPLGPLIFSVCWLHGGMVSVCGDKAVTTTNICLT